MIEKISGRVAYAVMSFGGFLGMGSDEHMIPWSKLTYDTSLGGYRTDITETSCVVRLRSHAIKTGTGVIAIENKNCTITSVRHTIGEYNRPGEERFRGKLLAGEFCYHRSRLGRERMQTSPGGFHGEAAADAD
jgi:hypothetical protein